MVYDLGGGTFDISCLFAQSAMYNQYAIEGDMWLGGDDFDQVIVDYCVDEIKKKHGVDPTGNRKVMFKLRQDAEVAKKSGGNADHRGDDRAGCTAKTARSLTTASNSPARPSKR